MRIAFLVGRFPSPTETFVLNQATALIDRGHQVDIYARRADASPKVHPDVDRYKLLTNTRYRPSLPSNALLRVGKAATILASSLSHVRTLSRTLNPFSLGSEALSLKPFYSAASMLGHGEYDIIHAHFGPNGLLADQLRRCGVLRGKLVTSFYGYDVSRYPKQHGSNIYRKLFANGEKFLALSQVMRHELIRLGCPEDKSVVHHIGIDCDRFAYLPRQLEDGESPRLISVARLVEKKGLEYAIRAIAKVAGQIPSIRYCIAGDGELRPALAALISELGMTNHIELVGWRDQSEIVRLLNDSHVLLAPSITASSGDQEGTPVALMEAMAMGLPVISTHHAGIPELVDDESQLVNERDTEGLAASILHMLKSPQTWHNIGNRQRKRIETGYNIHRLGDDLVRQYQQL